jgi:hypothetical protein
MRTRVVLVLCRCIGGSGHIACLFLADTGRKVGLGRLPMADRSLRNSSEASGALGSRTRSETCHRGGQKSSHAGGQKARAKRLEKIFRGVHHRILLAVHPTPLHLVPRDHR